MNHKFYEIHHVYDYVEQIVKLRAHYPKKSFCFRGISNINYRLIPAIFRTQSNSEQEFNSKLNLEFQILLRFIKEASGIVNNIPYDDYLKWMVYAQHFGAPTRLLDLSENPLISLFFACRSNSNSDNDGAVWLIRTMDYGYNIFNKSGCFDDSCINMVPEKLQEYVISEIINFMQQRHDTKKDFKCSEFPVFYSPYYLDQRMLIQSSKFLIWGTCELALDDMISEENYMILDGKGDGKIITSHPHQFVFKFKINKEDKKKIIRD